MKERNIQSLFLSIRMDQIRKYLLERGWKERLTSVRREFQKADEDSQETRTMILPLEESHPRYRSLVPNVVFSLAVESGMEAIDIAEEISKVEVPEPVSENKPVMPSAPQSPPSSPCRIEISNCGENPIVLTLSTSNSTMEIAPAESLLLSLKTNDGIVQIKADCGLGFAFPPECETRICFGFPSRDFLMESAVQLGDQIYASSDQWEEETIGSSGIRQLIVSASNRFLYEVEIPSCSVGTISNANLKCVTLMLVNLGRLMKANRESAMDLFSIARQLLKPFGVTFPYSIDLPDQLWVTFRSDDPESPRNSVELLRSNSTVSAGSLLS